MRTNLEEIFEDRKISLMEQIASVGILESINRGHSQTLAEVIKKKEGFSIISEIKLASPSLANINNEMDVVQVAQIMEEAGVVGISVLTEPNFFKGSFSNLKLISEITSVPLLMKDFVFNNFQFKVAQAYGASNILLINKLGNLETMYSLALDHNLEPLIEIHNKEEIKDLIHLEDIGLKPKLVGVNNRNLETMKIDLNTSQKLIPKVKETLGDETIVISESGINTMSDITNLLPCLADGFLIGSSIMKAENIRDQILKLRGLIEWSI